MIPGLVIAATAPARVFSLRRQRARTVDCSRHWLKPLSDKKAIMAVCRCQASRLRGMRAMAPRASIGVASEKATLYPAGQRHTRNVATEEHCACSIVELATGLKKNTVQTAWHDYQGVADQRTPTNYVGQAVVSVTYDGAQRHLLERFPRVVSDDGTQEHFLVSFPRVGSAKAMSRPSDRKAQRRAKAQRAKRVRD